MSISVRGCQSFRWAELPRSPARSSSGARMELVRHIDRIQGAAPFDYTLAGRNEGLDSSSRAASRAPGAAAGLGVRLRGAQHDPRCHRRRHLIPLRSCTLRDAPRGAGAAAGESRLDLGPQRRPAHGDALRPAAGLGLFRARAEVGGARVLLQGGGAARAAALRGDADGFRRHGDRADNRGAVRPGRSDARGRPRSWIGRSRRGTSRRSISRFSMLPEKPAGKRGFLRSDGDETGVRGRDARPLLGHQPDGVGAVRHGPRERQAAGAAPVASWASISSASHHHDSAVGEPERLRRRQGGGHEEPEPRHAGEARLVDQVPQGRRHLRLARPARAAATSRRATASSTSTRSPRASRPPTSRASTTSTPASRRRCSGSPRTT